jgi:hypothetical protein
VILLEPSVLQHPSILRLNPNRDPAKTCVYFGMTGLAVQDRLQNHKSGHLFLRFSFQLQNFYVALLCGGNLGGTRGQMP